MRLLLAGCALVLLVGCGAKDEDTVGPFTVTVTDQAGRPLAGWAVAVHLEDGSPIDSLRTGASGEAFVDIEPGDPVTVTVGDAPELASSSRLSAYLDVPEGTALRHIVYTQYTEVATTEVELPPWSGGDRYIRVFDNCGATDWQVNRATWFIPTYESCAPQHGGIDVAAIAWSPTSALVTKTRSSGLGAHILLPGWRPALSTKVTFHDAPPDVEAYSSISVDWPDTPRWFYGEAPDALLYYPPNVDGPMLLLAGYQVVGTNHGHGMEIGELVDTVPTSTSFDHDDRLPLPTALHFDSSDMALTWSDDGQGAGDPLFTVAFVTSAAQTWHLRMAPDRSSVVLPRDLVPAAAIYDSLSVQRFADPVGSYRAFLEHAGRSDAPAFGTWAASYSACRGPDCID